ncbi:hypothetical protein H4C80_07665 [Pseudomonas juntendi]|uniref:Imidazoleglycerol-phosphate synthase n=1 Tax=Pseudomonas juntendi TaxID=2666183 RepID=A0A7W2KEG0_9PSED|nr:hypothetical protein [Pseudomonas juntendi]MBA6097008.1 hypothetical protein [Pseudomonas juntendi]
MIMAGNSKRELLEALSEGDAVQGWGGILALGQGPANSLLQASYLEALRDQDMLLPISGHYYLDSQRTEQVVLDGLVLAPPRLSFKHATGRTSSVTAQFEMIAGRCQTAALQPGRASRLRRSHILQQGMGFNLEVTVKLAMRNIPGFGQAQLFVDFSEASHPMCTLGSTDTAARAMGEFILECLKGQAQFSRSLTLLTFDPVGYDALSFVDCVPIAMAAPVPQGSLPGDDGAVVLLMQLAGQAELEGIPSNLPYLLPEKQQGLKVNHGAALLIGKVRSTLIDAAGQRLLRQLLMPEGHEIEFSDDATPFDRIFFGEVGPGDATRRLQPGVSSVAAGSSLHFTAQGQPSASWGARNLRYPLATGGIDPQGRYTATAVENFAGEQNVIVVTATATTEQRTYTCSALVVESEYPLAISPRVSPWSQGDDPIELTASRAGSWALVGEVHGKLEPDKSDGRRATFTPDGESGGVAVRLQRIRVSDGDEHGYASIALTHTPTLQIEPFHVLRMASDSQQFALTEVEAESWEVYGVGEIDPISGLYRAPAPGVEAGEVSVVRGRAGRSGGYALIEHQRNAPMRVAAKQERWRELNEFSLSLNHPNRSKVLANGVQQVGIDITIVTNSFIDSSGETVFDPVSDLELSTLKLLGPGGAEIDYLPADQEALQPGGKLWAASKVRNRFDYLPTANATEVADALHAPNDGKRTLTVYVQTLSAEVSKFTAKFQAHDNGWWYSDDEPSKEKGEILLEGVPVPLPSLQDYDWADAGGGLRVAAEKGKDEIGSDGRPDIFNYWHYTTDYWQLQGRNITFVDVRFQNSSMIRWESEQANETFASYTGFGFNPRRRADAPEMHEGVEYSGKLQLLTLEPSVAYTRLDYALKGQYQIPRGTLLLTLDRTSAFPFWQATAGDYRKILDKPLSFTLTDNYGSAHSLMVTFRLGTDGRNELRLSLGAELIGDPS